MTSLQQRLARGDVVILDGGTGTELQRRGAPMHGDAWSAAAMATHPEVVRAVHEDYLRAGAEIVIANSFGTSRHVLEAAGLGGRVAELNRRAIAVVREARDRVAPAHPVWIAGSMSSFVPAGDQRRRPDPAAERANYREQAELLAAAGADLLMLEMLRDIEQSRAIVEAAAATGLPIIVGFTCTPLGSDGVVRLRGRDKERTLAECLGPVLAAAPCLAVAVMHSNFETSERALDVVAAGWQGPLACYPDSGEWINPDWRFGDLAPDDFASAAEGWVARGVQIVGGCCGTGPEHIRSLAERLRGRRIADPAER
jgi:S-methylmethionine-dependent homocysteine/selenocysteine methylase